MNYYHVQDTEIMVRRNGMEKRIFRRGTAERAGEFAEKFGKREWGYYHERNLRQRLFSDKSRLNRHGL